MSEMIERVARAIYQGRNGTGCKAWAHLPKAHQGPYLADARAAIEAMREPTEAMEEAGSEESIMIDPFACNIWEAMINAALREER